ncbi:hypothetical protein M885DRAFT_517018 [Pelagophyceae sp. CCMP2097]|nr:hypothetical protein M885DRAFT_517018 [Pelagophyceae sp. CCMP2097]
MCFVRFVTESLNSDFSCLRAQGRFRTAPGLAARAQRRKGRGEWGRFDDDLGLERRCCDLRSTASTRRVASALSRCSHIGSARAFPNAVSTQCACACTPARVLSTRVHTGPRFSHYTPRRPAMGIAARGAADS